MRINIKVVANAKNDEVIEGSPLIVRVSASAEKNKANIAVIKLLSRHFKKPVRIVSGLASKNKVIDF